MSVYLLHLSRPYQHAKHYVGFAEQVERRLEHHRNGTGARFLAVCVDAGIDFVVAKVWPDADRTFERRLKNTKNVARYCPQCAGKRVREYRPKKENN